MDLSGFAAPVRVLFGLTVLTFPCPCPPDSLLTSGCAFNEIIMVCRELGITPVLSGFNGHVPEALLKRVHPTANRTRARPWNGTANEPLRRPQSCVG